MPNLKNIAHPMTTNSLHKSPHIKIGYLSADSAHKVIQENSPKNYALRPIGLGLDHVGYSKPLFYENRASI